jgi:hypothetical protein
MKANLLSRQFLGSMKKYLLVGLLIREALSFWTGHPYDFEIWVRLGVYMQHLGDPYTTLPYVQGLSFTPYSVTGSISYLPFSAFIFAGIYKLYLSTGITSRFLYYFILKQPIVLSDLAVGLVLARIALYSFGDERGRGVLKIWMLFPYAIIVSSVWGALDPFALFLILASVYCFQQGRTVLSGITLGLAIYLKTLPVIALPVLLMQPEPSFTEKLQLSSLSLLIPVLGTLVPAVGLGWGFSGMFNNVSFQVILPTYGAVSVFGPLGLVSVPAWAKSVTGFLWFPALVLAYFYIRKQRFGLPEGLMTAFLVFSVSRPFLPEQWAIYPLGFLLLARNSTGNFIGLAITGLAGLVANNTLLVRFLTPISLAAFNWDYAINNLSGFANLRTVILFISAGLYLLESALTWSGRPSLVFQALSSASLRARRVSQLEMWKLRRT